MSEPNFLFAAKEIPGCSDESCSTVPRTRADKSHQREAEISDLTTTGAVG